MKRSINNDTCHNGFPVSKFFGLNICGLNKTKNRVCTSVALAVDLKTVDIDATIISESYLNGSIPDSSIGIEGYNVYRRDRNWAGNDKRKKRWNCGLHQRKCKGFARESK